MPERFAPERIDQSAYPRPGYDLQVMYGDLDTNHHVNNVALQRYFEQGRYLVHLDAGLDRLLSTSGGNLFVVHLGIDFLAETVFGIPLHVRTRLGRLGHSSFVEEQAAWQDGRCVALAEVVTVWTEGEGRSASLPHALRSALTSTYNAL